MEDGTGRSGARPWFALAGVALAALALCASNVTPFADIPPAHPGFTVSIATGVTTTTSAHRAAAIARHYLDLQTPELAAPEIHRAPMVLSVSAVRAADVGAIEPRVPAQEVAARPGRVVWVASATGDFLNLHDLPWSMSGTPDRIGNILIDDATGSILGVYPSVPERSGLQPAPSRQASGRKPWA